MISHLFKPAPILFVLVAAFGVLVHDTQLDRATTMALALPTAFASFIAAEQVLQSSEHHVHVEKISTPNHIVALRATLPRTQPRDDEQRYSQKRLQYSGGGGTSYIWPSI